MIVYDATVYFCSRNLSKRDRTCDQMVQAARSDKQNIIEGSLASGTSKKMEIKLTNVIIGLIKVTTCLLSRQISHLEKSFIEEGGLSERTTRARLAERSRRKKNWDK